MEWSGFALLLSGRRGHHHHRPARRVRSHHGCRIWRGRSASAADTIPFSLLSALPNRLVNLFENDLLQALPLYVTMGLLLGRLPVADALYRTATRCCRGGRRRRWSPA